MAQASRTFDAVPLRHLIKGTGATFAIACAILVPFVGLRTESGPAGQLVVTAQFPAALALAAAAAILRAAGLRFGPYVLALFRDTVPGNLVIPGGAVFVTGAVLYLQPALPAAAVNAASSASPVAGQVASLMVFSAMAVFAVGTAVAIIQGGRRLFLRSTPAAQAQRRTDSSPQTVPYALFLVALALPLAVIGPSQGYVLGVATQMLIYIMLGWGLNVVVGLAGLLDLGYVAFYAVGAYTTALLTTGFGFPFWACLPLSGLLAALFGIALGFPVLRLRGDYLAIVTLAFGEIIRIVLLNWQSVTGGPNGINGIPAPTLFGLTFSKAGEQAFHKAFGLAFDPVYKIVFLYYSILSLALMANWVTLRLRRIPIGRAWEALREDEIACRSLGIDTVTSKLSAFAIGATFAGLAGAFFAVRQGFISPESFTFQESALVLAIVVLGGLGSQTGVVLAAVVLLGSLEKLRDLQDYRMLIFGMAMVAIMIARPRGLAANRTPAVLLDTNAQAARLAQAGSAR